MIGKLRSDKPEVTMKNNRPGMDHIQIMERKIIKIKMAALRSGSLQCSHVITLKTNFTLLMGAIPNQSDE